VGADSNELAALRVAPSIQHAATHRPRQGIMATFINKRGSKDWDLVGQDVYPPLSIFKLASHDARLRIPTNESHYFDGQVHIALAIFLPASSPASPKYPLAPRYG